MIYVFIIKMFQDQEKGSHRMWWLSQINEASGVPMEVLLLKVVKAPQEYQPAYSSCFQITGLRYIETT